MKLKVQDWKEFIVERLFDSIYKAKAHTKDEVLETEHGLHFVSRTDINNGVDISVEHDDYEGIEQKNCITIGDTTATCYYQNEDFIAGDHMVVLRAKWMNELRGLFIRTLFALECPRYSYGRAYRMELIKATKMMLPIQHNSDGTPVIDANKTYSDDGYIPDWQFMEDYIESLHSKPITTKVSGDAIPDLEIDKWEEFRIGTLFELSNGKNKSAGDLEDGDDINYIGAKCNDNGVMNRVKLVPENVSEGNCVIFICNGQGSVGYSIYMDKDFIGTADIVTGYNDNLNCYIGLFIATVASLERPRYSFGRKWKKTLSETIIKLPIQRDENGNPIIDVDKKYSDKGFIPDWQFMENYIKSLPYSDRICVEN